MSQPHMSQRDNKLLSITAYLTVITVGVVGVRELEQPGYRWIALGLLIGFVVLLIAEEQGRANSYAWVYLLIQGAIVTALLLLPSSNSLYAILFFILSAQAMLLYEDRQGMRWMGVFGLLTALTFINKWGVWPGLLLAFVHVGGYAFFGAFASALKRAAAANEHSQALLAELQAAHTQLKEYALRVEELAATQERNRLAREMHDTLGYRLTVASVQLEAAQRLIPTSPDRATGMIQTVRDQVREALGELRSTVAALRAPLEIDLSLPNALRRLATSFEQATGLTVHLLIPAELPELPAPQRQALYRAAQEALTNAQRHAGAGQIWLQLSATKEQISLLAADDGAGIPPTREQAGFGLLGLRERATQLGGALHIEPRTGGGTQLIFTLPLGQEVLHV